MCKGGKGQCVWIWIWGDLGERVGFGSCCVRGSFVIGYLVCKSYTKYMCDA